MKLLIPQMTTLLTFNPFSVSSFGYMSYSEMVAYYDHKCKIWGKTLINLFDSISYNILFNGFIYIILRIKLSNVENIAQKKNN